MSLFDLSNINVQRLADSYRQKSQRSPFCLGANDDHRTITMLAWHGEGRKKRQNESAIKEDGDRIVSKGRCSLP